ncbi:MAG: ABC transporter permease [Candidatus Bathyarchaeota archaeon]|nr:ABC transporter permease [Candidatus Bathyarchaeota archaeon]MDH5788567.1 ABC transporter permease [Candidatus Bathyarchaeota archaeon]
MSETFFPINDLLRRKLQTSLTIISLTLCVASTLFLLLFSEKIGFGISLMVEGKLTSSFSSVFSRFIIFVSFLVFTVGALIMSFMIFLMISQRVRDIGLMKAAGCTNDLIFGYFMTELLIVTFISCGLGVVLGITADFFFAGLLNTLGFQVLQEPPNFWIALLVFALYFVLALILGAKPVLDSAKLEPVKAFSPTHYLGLSRESGFEVFSKLGFAPKVAMRNLFRRKSGTFQIIVCLTTIFILVTVSIAGGIIANQTTKDWVEKAVGRDVVLIAQKDMINQYELSLAKFHEVKEDSHFDYSDEKYSIPEDILSILNSTEEITDIDERLVLKTHVEEIQTYRIIPETGATIPVGDDREGESLIIGIEPGKALNNWFLEGKLLHEDQSFEAMIGDSLAQKMFSTPLIQGIRLFDTDFAVIGICLDPIENGNVTYVPLKTLQEITGKPKPNGVMIKIDPSANRTQILSQIKNEIGSINFEFEVLELNEVLDKNLGFLSYIWSSIMFLPLFALASASLCLIGYVMLAIAEQRQEFGVLRAVGAKPKTIIKIVLWQNFLVLLSSCAIGISSGVIITLMILVSKPLVTIYATIEITGWLLIALVILFILGVYPAVRFAKKPILEIIA